MKIFWFLLLLLQILAKGRFVCQLILTTKKQLLLMDKIAALKA